MVTVKDIFGVGIMGQSLSQRALSKAYYISHVVIDAIYNSITIVYLLLYVCICMKLQGYEYNNNNVYNIHYV